MNNKIKIIKSLLVLLVAASANRGQLNWNYSYDFSFYYTRKAVYDLLLSNALQKRVKHMVENKQPKTCLTQKSKLASDCKIT